MSSFTLELYETDMAAMDGESETFSRFDQDEVIIGRGSQLKNVDFKVWARHKGAEIISRQHAKIVRTWSKNAKKWLFHIYDLNALNGTFVDNIRVNEQ